jgi:hypothetical protein
MEHKITTIRDAERVIRDWAERYLEQPTDAQVEAAAGQLVAHVGGYGNILTAELSESFDLDAALGD